MPRTTVGTENNAPIDISADGWGAPHELIRGDGVPETVAGWKAVTDGLLTSQCCAFHRNVEISSRYAWLYRHLPACFKWAGMAAIASRIRHRRRRDRPPTNPSAIGAPLRTRPRGL